MEEDEKWLSTISKLYCAYLYNYVHVMFSCFYADWLPSYLYVPAKEVCKRERERGEGGGGGDCFTGLENVSLVSFTWIPSF